MGHFLVSLGGSLILGGSLLALYTLYRLALPTPLKGIPYNEDAAGNIFGDVPEMMAYVMRTKRVFCWLTSLTKRHHSPIVQAFAKPMALPWVVLTDPFESQDILLRRTKEFDRSGFFGDLINSILPEQHIQFLSTDERFKKNRNLINHLMAPTFISQVSGPEVYKAAETLIKLWELKCDLAQGRPFAAQSDITSLALDSIFASSFGLPLVDSNTYQRLQMIQQWQPGPARSSTPQQHDVNAVVPFPEDANVPEVFSAVLTLANSVTDIQLSPLPRLTSWVIRKFPYMRRATAIKDDYISAKTEECIALIGKGDMTPRSALHSVLLRERDVAAKEGRPPAYRRRGIADEFFGFMTAGHDTSATTVAWGVKYLADHPDSQQNLRAALHVVLNDAVREKRSPTSAELATMHVPYLDAVVEEVLRHANTIAFVVRRAQVDTTVLGRAIPAGTDIFLMANGAGYLEPNMPVTDFERRTVAQESKKLTGKWEDVDIGVFRPERWLKTGDNREVVFDPVAGPTLAFGLGPRGCFGRRLALQTLKLQFTLIVWHFELLQCPATLSGYNAVQRFAREPTDCYARLSRVSL
ncbi:unnamed protein product [Discula destructiva]